MVQRFDQPPEQSEFVETAFTAHDVGVRSPTDAQSGGDAEQSESSQARDRELARVAEG